MIARVKFELIKKTYGRHASWAVWADGASKPKENVGDLSIFESDGDDALLRQLNPNIVLVGLNISRRIEFALGNFHDGRAHAMDYKLRYALKGTALWGAYMTDIIKDFEQRASGRMMAYLRKNKGFEKDNVKLFETELSDLGVNQPTLIALGKDAFQILNRNLGRDYEIWRVPHYSNYISKESYREEIAAVVQSKSNQPNKTTHPTLFR
jgi:hypothetical protein